ncbi:MAG: methylated-DNA--[protein]-cysteine S-methyltransferase [Deltaproteobacteria bacterium]|nr:MAG: methylated-DNA--[protein]-cysteine S-methyltransferase [Deltaproteobacteria bacterium]
MKRKPSVCQEIEPALVATAIGDADTATATRVEAHTRACARCRQDLVRYGAIERAVGVWRGAPAPAEELARERLTSRLADLRRRTLLYRIFPSPLGPILIARSEEGVSCIEYLTGGSDFAHSRLQDLLEYVQGRRNRLEWPLDLRLARSEFHRAVLEATVRIPYGAVRSYAGIARELRKPAATRAVAQALRWNPLPIVVPCHRVIGTSGALTGYAGNRVTLKQRLLAVEGVRTRPAHHDFRIERDAMYVRAEEDTESYCLPTCGALAERSLAELTLFASGARAEAAGLAPCTSCRPDLHPISR